MNLKFVIAGLLLCAIAAVGVGSAAPYSQTIATPSGWSTIATPYDASVASLALSGIDAGVRWDGTNWVTVLPYGETTIPATSAIFVHSTSGGSITLESVPGIEAINSDGYVPIPLGTGWNFVGISPRIVDNEWSEEMCTVDNAFSWTTLTIISPAANDGYCWETGDGGTILDVYKGYWVHVGTGTVNQYWV